MNRYKFVISGKSIYKEIELSSDISEVRIGTTSGCNVRLKREYFFGGIEIVLMKRDEEWFILFSDGIRGTFGGTGRFISRKLAHGDEFQIIYQDSEVVLFEASFMLDFDYDVKNYNLEIDIARSERIQIGRTSDCDICICGEYSDFDKIVLSRKGQHTYISNTDSSLYCVFVNGTRITEFAEIRNMDFFSIAEVSFFYKNGRLYTSAQNISNLKNLSSQKLDEQSTAFKYPHFNRHSRVQYVVSEDELEILSPTQKPSPQKKNLLMSLIPALIMLALTILLRGVIGNGGVFVIYCAASMTIGIVTSVITYIQANKDYKTQCTNRIKSYNEYIQKKETAIQASRENELRVDNLIYQDLGDSVKEAEYFGSRLFERRPQDKDFLHIYLGKGTIKSANQVSYKVNEFADPEDPLSSLPETVANKYTYIENAPIYSDFKESCGVGVVGTPNKLVQMIKNMTLDIVIRHFYSEVRLVYILKEGDISKFEWIHWLRNVENKALDIRNIGCDDESKGLILEYLYKILSERESDITHKDEPFDEYYVVLVTDTSVINTHPISKYIGDCAKYGFTFVFFEELEENLPLGCREIVRMYHNRTGGILKTENGDIEYAFAMPMISDQVAHGVAMKLAAVETDEVSLQGELTKNYTMYEMLNILSVEDIDLGDNWKKDSAYRSLAAPLGINRKGDIIYLDIGDRQSAHGPHGLVAGTTGSGKSEILQTYILSMSILYHPYEVGFVIIDFKGGGMSNQFKDLPHLIGTITNIDGREIERSLLSIKAELVKRQEVFSKYGVNHINDYIKLYEVGKAEMPLPHLIMIVDEFAELKQEYPDFMKELISASRIGRTLGVHLILATQKPAGVVDAQIWSNSKFKLCLKVQTKEDSNEVIKTPLAAEIVEAGRAYFQVGNNEIFELFQSAYSGAGIPEGNENKDITFSIYEKNIWGKKMEVYTNRKSKATYSSVTQLQAIVNHIHDYCDVHNIFRLPGICLPALTDKISTEDLVYECISVTSVSVPIGVFDDPEQQRQGIVELDISKDNTYIVGSSQTGKTVMLQTILYGLIRKYTPTQVQCYIVDCGSMVLKLFENSAHVGGVVLSSEEEKCKNLFKMLFRFVAQRRRVLSEKGVGSYSAYLEAGYTDMPVVAIIIDNMSAFKEYFPNQAEELEILTREAQGVGISFIIATGNSNALNYRTQGNFGKRFVLNCNDTNEYSNMFGHCRKTPKENPGRGLFVLDKRILEFQVALYGKSDKEAERNIDLKRYIEKRNSKCETKAVEIPMVPNKLVLDEEMRNNPLKFRNKGILPVGMDFETVELTSIQLSRCGSLTLFGNSEGRDRFTRCFLNMIASNIIFHDITAVVVDDRNASLQFCKDFGFVREYHSSVTDGLMAVEDFCNDVEEKLDDQPDDGYSMLVINSIDVLRKICSDKDLSKRMANVVRRAVEAKVFVLFANVDNQPVGFNSSELLKTIKDERQAILFAQLSECKLLDVTGRVKTDVGFDSSMAYRFDGISQKKIKLFE
ncbi:MAG: type VII secretion protein EssC [Oscillospiraceae bacterium]|nr:type VII secretion protein EssC [Oscillospiraceae bacterium]